MTKVTKKYRPCPNEGYADPSPGEGSVICISLIILKRLFLRRWGGGPGGGSPHPLLKNSRFHFFYRYCAQCSETNEESIFPFLRISFSQI